MKRGILLVLLVFIIPVVAALPPSFHLFSGYVSCNDSLVDGKSLTLTVFNSTDSAESSVALVDGLYYVVIDSEAGNDINFSAGETFLGNYTYQPYGVNFGLNFTIDSGDAFCVVDSDPGNDGDNDGDGSGGGDGDDDDDTPSGGGSYCGDGTCNSGELCDICLADCGECDAEEPDDFVVNLDEALTVEILTSGGDHTLIFGEEEISFNVFNISEERIMIDILDNSYEILFGGAGTFFIGEQEIQVSYLGNNDEIARVAFSKVSHREVTTYSIGNFIYYVAGVIVFAVVVFFIIRAVNKRRSLLTKPSLTSRVKA